MSCNWCGKTLSNFCVQTDEGMMHTWCKISQDNPEKSDAELWDLIDPPGNPMPLPRNKEWPAPRRKDE